MFVIDRKNLKVIEVPDDYIECAVCLEWKPADDFKSEQSGEICRANCKSCFTLPFDEFQDKRVEAANYLSKLKSDGSLRMTMRALKTELRIRENGISKDKLRELFADILNSIPDDAIVDCSGGEVYAAQALSNNKQLFKLNFEVYDED